MFLLFLGQHRRVQSQEGTGSALFWALSNSSRRQPSNSDALESISYLLSMFIVISKEHC